MKSISIFNKFSAFLFVVIILSNISFSQIENVPADHSVYPFLKKMQVQGVIEDYNDVIIPLSRKKIIDELNKIELKKNNLSSSDYEFYLRMKEKFISPGNSSLNLFDNFPLKFGKNLIADSQKHLYSFNDSLISFFVEPIAEYKFIYSDKINSNSSLINFGGIIRGSYDNWLGFYAKATNGILTSSREAAALDQRVKQSFTFFHTKRNNFDVAEGYLRFEKGIVNLQLGRERILWGTGYINKMMLGNNPPVFDFVKFNISYKSLSYNFLHGWLVHPVNTFYVDSLKEDLKQKPSKFVAISRLNFSPNPKLNLGISQMIIYSNRPFELAYLNPFLFWESAQRSINDLDNSFLSFDGRYLITYGFEFNSSIIFDDINFERLFKGEWAGSNNGTAWQIGGIFTKPLMPDNLILKVEYIQLRPYVFSHPGGYEALTFTNNGYLLGTGLQPNSTLFSTSAEYRFTGKISAEIKYEHELHGKNFLDDNGNLVNVGGNVFQNLKFNDSNFAYLLDGIREAKDRISFNFNYEITYGIYFNFMFEYNSFSSEGTKNKENILWTSLKLNLE